MSDAPEMAAALDEWLAQNGESHRSTIVFIVDDDGIEVGSHIPPKETLKICRHYIEKLSEALTSGQVEKARASNSQLN